MTAVTFFDLDEEANRQRLGTITLVDGHLVADPPDSVGLRNVLAEEVWRHEKKGSPTILSATLHPQAFLDALPKQYHGSYFWCEPVED